MTAYALEREQRIPRPLPEVFPFFARAGNLELITPPWLNFRLDREPGELHPGARITYRLKVHGVPMRWVSLIEAFEPERRFVDRQISGPYRLWRHQHDFLPDGDSTIVRDHVRYALPLGLVGSLAHAAFVRRDLERIFSFRQQTVARLLG